MSFKNVMMLGNATVAQTRVLREFTIIYLLFGFSCMSLTENISGTWFEQMGSNIFDACEENDRDEFISIILYVIYVRIYYLSSILRTSYRSVDMMVQC